MLKEFREFAMRGNVLDMAVGIVIGGAFGKIVSSLVADVIMPPIGLLLGQVDFSSLFLNLSGESYATLAEAQAAGAPTLNYGLFVQSIVNFLIVAFAIFLLIQRVNAWQRQPPPKPAEPTTKECPECCSTIPIRAKRCPSCTAALAA